MQALRIFFRNKWLEIVIVAFAFQLITTAISGFLEKPLLIFLTAVCLMLFVCLIISTQERMKEKNRIIDPGDALKIPRKGVILTLGRKSGDANSPAAVVLRELTPNFCGFLGTKETNDDGVAATIINGFSIGAQFYKEKIVDPTSVKEIKDDTTHLIQWLLNKGLSKQDIVVDITGGTAIMSVAAYIAADENNVDIQYIYSEYRDNRPIPGTQKDILVSMYETR